MGWRHLVGWPDLGGLSKWRGPGPELDGGSWIGCWQQLGGSATPALAGGKFSSGLGATVRCFYERESYDALAPRSGTARALGLGLGLGLASFGFGLAFLSQFFVVCGPGTGLLLLPGSLCSRGQGLVCFLLFLGQVVGVVAPI